MYMISGNSGVVLKSNGTKTPIMPPIFLLQQMYMRSWKNVHIFNICVHEKCTYLYTAGNICVHICRIFVHGLSPEMYTRVYTRVYIRMYARSQTRMYTSLNKMYTEIEQKCTRVLYTELAIGQMCIINWQTKDKCVSKQRKDKNLVMQGQSDV